MRLAMNTPMQTLLTAPPLSAQEAARLPKGAGMNDEQKREAATDLSANVLWLIEQVLVKHNIAIIEASKEAIDDAVAKEREECAKIVDKWFNSMSSEPEMAEIAAEIRARGAP